MKIVKALGTMLLGLVTIPLIPFIILGTALYEMGHDTLEWIEGDCEKCRKGEH